MWPIRPRIRRGLYFSIWHNISLKKQRKNRHWNSFVWNHIRFINFRIEFSSIKCEMDEGRLHAAALFPCNSTYWCNISLLFHTDSDAPNFGSLSSLLAECRDPIAMQAMQCYLIIQLHLFGWIGRRESVSGISCKTCHRSEIHHFMRPQGMIRLHLMSVCRHLTVMGEWPLILNTPTPWQFTEVGTIFNRNKPDFVSLIDGESRQLFPISDISPLNHSALVYIRRPSKSWYLTGFIWDWIKCQNIYITFIIAL